MAKVACEVEEVLIDDNGREQPGVEVTCTRCDHVTQSFGTSEKSVKRCLVLLREECPNNENNFYSVDE